MVITLTLSLLASAAAAFDVRCELGGAHGDDSDRQPHQTELRLLREAVADAYPGMPDEVKKVADAIVLMIPHSQKDWTKFVFGWGPEDDADYRYPDTKFYPEGTIKANFSERTLAALALGEELSKQGALVARGARSFSRYMVVHVLTHALQYHKAPVQDILALETRSSGLCRDGLLPKELLGQAEKRLAYEKAAFASHRAFIDKEGMLAYADAIEARYKSHPREFGPGGRFRLLAADAPNPLVPKLREEAPMAGQGGTLGPLASLMNDGQVVPHQIIGSLVRLNGAAGRPRRFELEELQALWERFMVGENLKLVKKVLACPPAELEARYSLELARARRKSEEVRR